MASENTEEKNHARSRPAGIRTPGKSAVGGSADTDPKAGEVLLRVGAVSIDLFQMVFRSGRGMPHVKLAAHHG